MSSTIFKVNPNGEFYFAEGCYILELYNIPDDPDASIARARITPGMATQLHRLHGITERYTILEGSGIVEIDGLAAQPVGPGDMVMVTPASSQKITNNGDTDLIFLVVCTPRFVLEAYEEIETEQTL
jgi:mannose-6-phosphate isomerase-like protein (cupin superfamily)